MREGEGGRRVGGRSGGDLVQGVAGEAAAEAPVERAGKAHLRGARPVALQRGDGAAQMGNPFGPVGGRHPLSIRYVLYLF